MNITDILYAKALGGSGGGGGSSDFSIAEVTILNPIQASGLIVHAPIVGEYDEYSERFIAADGILIDGEESKVINVVIPKPTAEYETAYTILTLDDQGGGNYMFDNLTGDISLDGAFNIWVSGNGTIEIAPFAD